MIQKLIKILIPVAVLAILINDGGHYLVTKYNLGETTTQAAQTAAEAARRNQAEPNATWQAAQSYAQKNGADVYGFELKGGQVHIWTKQPVNNLWVLGFVYAAVNRQDLKTPLVLDDDGFALVQ